MNPTLTRRQLLGLTGALGIGLGTPALSACSGVGGAVDGSGGDIRFAWYGGTERQNAYTELLQIYSDSTGGEAVVAPEYADYTPYQDRLATQLAAGDAPDVFWMTAFNVLDFHTNGQLLDLGAQIDSGDLDLSGMDPAQVESWRLDGIHDAIPYAYFSPACQVNLTLLEESGLELPDEESWTWQDYADLCNEYSSSSPEGQFGSTYDAWFDLPFASWLRQHNQDLFTADGQIGFDADGVGAWLDFWEQLRASGGAMSVQEQEGIDPEWSLVGSRALFKLGNSNHLANNQPAVDDELDVRLLPVIPDAAEGHHYLFFQRMGVYSQTEAPEQAARLMSFLINDPNVPRLVGQNIGVPTNVALRQVATETADATGQKVIRVTELEGTFPSRPKPEVPPGAGTWRNLMGASIEAVALDGADIAAESQRFIDELTESINRAA